MHVELDATKVGIHYQPMPCRSTSLCLRLLPTYVPIGLAVQGEMECYIFARLAAREAAPLALCSSLRVDWSHCEPFCSELLLEESVKAALHSHPSITVRLQALGTPLYFSEGQETFPATMFPPCPQGHDPDVHNLQLRCLSSLGFRAGSNISVQE